MASRCMVVQEKVKLARMALESCTGQRVSQISSLMNIACWEQSLERTLPKPCQDTVTEKALGVVQHSAREQVNNLAP